MKSRSVFLFTVCISFIALTHDLSAQPSDQKVKPLTFIVRNGGTVKEISAQIHVPAGDILKANKLRSKHFLAYPGLTLIIPVPIQPRTWDPSREGRTGRSPSKEDRHESQDFEIVIDTGNYRILEDFVNLADAEGDSTEYENIGRHIRRIDKRILNLYFKIDSMKQVDFKFEDESAPDPVSMADNMKMARDKFYSESPLGRQLDSLKAIKNWLGQRRTVLKNQISDYEYLVDNAGYSEHTYRHQQPKNSDWGQSMAYERIFLQSKDPTVASNNKKKSLTSASADNAALGLSPDKDLVEKNEPAISRTSKQNVIIHHRSDYAVINTRTPLSEIKSTHPYHRALLLFTGRVVAQVVPKPEEKVVVKDIRDIRTDDKHTGALVPGTLDRVSARNSETKTQTVVEQPKPIKPEVPVIIKTETVVEKTAPVKPAAPVVTIHDSVPVLPSTSATKDPGNESSKKPKYLQPVDSTTRIKGQFYIILAREAVDKGDFKSADKNLRKSLDINQNNAEAWMLHADILLTTGSTDQSLKEYLISSEIDSLNPKVFYNIALLYSQTKNTQNALKYFSRAIEVNRKYLLAYMGRASLLMDGQDYDGAIADYDKVLAINKFYSDAFKGRGLAKMEQHKFTEAISDFDMYLGIEKPDGFILYQRGLCRIRSNDLLKGCLDLSAARDLGFKDADKAIKKFCQ